MPKNDQILVCDRLTVTVPTVKDGGPAAAELKTLCSSTSTFFFIIHRSPSSLLLLCLNLK